MYSKRSQLQINETILVLIILSVLAISGIVVFHKYQTSSINSMILENDRQAFVELLSRVPDMPELKCSSQNIEEQCLDLFKVIGFQKVSKDYFDTFGYKTIEFELIYPDFPEKECTESDFASPSFPNCNKITLYSRDKPVSSAKEILSSPVAVYDPLTDSYLLALMRIEWQY